MTMVDERLEERLVAAFRDARTTVEPSPDLFWRVQRTLEEAKARRTFRLRIAAAGAAMLVAIGVTVAATIDTNNGRYYMEWWVIELITTLILVALAVFLGPFIKRFGRAYAADVFRANPRTGKSYLVLTDVAYYLIFASFIIFTTNFVAPENWVDSTAEQLEGEFARIGGILLLMGILHSLNILALPVVGRLLSLNKRLDDQHAAGVPSAGGPMSAGVPPLGPGTWIVRVEPGATAPPPAAPPPAEPQE